MTSLQKNSATNISLRVCLSEKKNKKILTPPQIVFLLKNIITGPNYVDFGHFSLPRAVRGVWGAYVGFWGVCSNQFFQFPHGTVFGPEMSFFGPN